MRCESGLCSLACRVQFLPYPGSQLAADPKRQRFLPHVASLNGLSALLKRIPKMIKDHRRCAELSCLAQIALGLLELLQFEVSPPKTVEIRSILWLGLDRPLNHRKRLFDFLVALNHLVAQVVQRERVVRIQLQDLSKRGLGLSP